MVDRVEAGIVDDVPMEGEEDEPMGLVRGGMVVVVLRMALSDCDGRELPGGRLTSNTL